MLKDILDVDRGEVFQSERDSRIHGEQIVLGEISTNSLHFIFGVH